MDTFVFYPQREEGSRTSVILYSGLMDNFRQLECPIGQICPLLLHVCWWGGCCAGCSIVWCNATDLQWEYWAPMWCTLHPTKHWLQNKQMLTAAGACALLYIIAGVMQLFAFWWALFLLSSLLSSIAWTWASPFSFCFIGHSFVGIDLVFALGVQVRPFNAGKWYLVLKP